MVLVLVMVVVNAVIATAAAIGLETHRAGQTVIVRAAAVVVEAVRATCPSAVDHAVAVSLQLVPDLPINELEEGVLLHLVIKVV